MRQPLPEPLELGGVPTTSDPRSAFPGISPAIELRHIRFALSAADHGSFRRAAQALNVEPSALSRRIADLEHHLGARLFERLPLGVRLTREGSHFLTGAREALDHIGRISRAIGETARQERDTLRIGFPPGLVPHVLLDALREAQKRRPQLRVEVTERGAREHRAALMNQKLDVGFLPGRPGWEGCESRVLRKERLVVVCPADHRLAAKTEITWPDLRDEQLLTAAAEPGLQIAQHMRNRLAGHPGAPATAPQAVGLHTLPHLVSIGQGLAVTIELAAPRDLPDIIYRPIAGEVWPFSAVWATHNAKPALRRLLGLVQNEGAAGLRPAAAETAWG
jgi:DNA-binding transcriptional LysR family regulator